MNIVFHKPEQCLERMEELHKLGMTSHALRVVSQALDNRRFRGVASPALEQLLIRYVQIAVDMHRCRNVRDAVLLCQRTFLRSRPKALQNILEAFRQAAADKFDAMLAEHYPDVEPAMRGREELAQLAKIDSRDESGVQSQEFMSAVLTESENVLDTREAILVQAMRTRWEAFRIIMDVIKNNAVLRKCYERTAQQALDFCMTYGRTLEFRRCCEWLRVHVTNMIVQENAGNSEVVSLRTPSVLAKLVQIRLHQLKAAIHLEQWREGLQIAEEITTLKERAPLKPHVIARYFALLSKILKKYDLFTLHTFVEIKIFDIKKRNMEEWPTVMVHATRTVMAALVQVFALSDDSGQTGTIRVAHLLHLAEVPSHAQVAGALKDSGCLQAACPAARSLYELMMTRDVLSEGFIQKASQWLDEILAEFGDATKKTCEFHFLGLKTREAIFQQALTKSTSQTESPIENLRKMATDLRILDGPSLDRRIIDFFSKSSTRVLVSHAEDKILFNWVKPPSMEALDSYAGILPERTVQRLQDHLDQADTLVESIYKCTTTPESVFPNFHARLLAEEEARSRRLEALKAKRLLKKETVRKEMEERRKTLAQEASKKRTAEKNRQAEAKKQKEAEKATILLRTEEIRLIKIVQANILKAKPNLGKIRVNGKDFKDVRPEDLNIEEFKKAKEAFERKQIKDLARVRKSEASNVTYTAQRLLEEYQKLIQQEIEGRPAALAALKAERKQAREAESKETKDWLGPFLPQLREHLPDLLPPSA